MTDEIRMPMEVPLDSDGYLRRQCPTCDKQFKWYVHDTGEPEAISTDQYFCPLCGQASSADTWITSEQLEHGRRLLAPQMEQHVQDSIRDMVRGSKFFEFKPNPDFSLGMPSPEPLVEPDDMVIVEPPCHPAGTLKVPEDATSRVHCLVCGEPFAA